MYLVIARPDDVVAHACIDAIRFRTGKLCRTRDGSVVLPGWWRHVEPSVFNPVALFVFQCFALLLLLSSPAPERWPVFTYSWSLLVCWTVVMNVGSIIRNNRAWKLVSDGRIVVIHKKLGTLLKQRVTVVAQRRNQSVEEALGDEFDRVVELCKTYKWRKDPRTSAEDKRAASELLDMRLAELVELLEVAPNTLAKLQGQDGSV